jgi:carboxypeptidase C (cathepsin A)
MKYVAIWIAILAVIVASRRFSLSEVVDIIIGPVIYLNGWISDLHNLGKLYTDYQTFKNNYQQPSVIIPARTTDEQAIIAYYRMIESGKALSDKQMQRYHALLSQRATKINRLQSKLRNECVKCAAHVINQSNHFFTMAIHDLRNGNSISVDAYDSLQHAAFTHSESLSVNRVLRALISRSCLSRVLLRAMSEATTRRKLISFVVPVHKEFNRLKSPLESPLGEDFFFRKRRELSVLFAGIKNLQW